MVATDVPGCREISIPGETGFLIRVDDTSALAEAMTKLSADPGLRQRYGAAARRLTEQKLSSRAIGEETAELYASLIDR
jgi:glycosyltransferase involved in cell wall biosynthesis